MSPWSEAQADQHLAGPDSTPLPHDRWKHLTGCGQRLAGRLRAGAEAVLVLELRVGPDRDSTAPAPPVKGPGAPAPSAGITQRLQRRQRAGSAAQGSRLPLGELGLTVTAAPAAPKPLASRRRNG